MDRDIVVPPLLGSWGKRECRSGYERLFLDSKAINPHGSLSIVPFTEEVIRRSLSDSSTRHAAAGSSIFIPRGFWCVVICQLEGNYVQRPVDVDKQGEILRRCSHANTFIAYNIGGPIALFRKFFLGMFPLLPGNRSAYRWNSKQRKRS